MSTHATASKQWTEADLARLPTENGVRQRGLEVTRLDTFIDAAFAFSLTILVISFDAIPTSYDEMIEAVKRIPAFFMSFTVLMLFWVGHRGWSRRYGLETRQTIFLSLSIIFVTLVYVYPLRIIFEAMFADWTDGYFPSAFRITQRHELQGMFLFYSSGSLIMSLLFWNLYRSALKCKDALNLNEAEQLATKVSMMNFVSLAIFGAGRGFLDGE